MFYVTQDVQHRFELDLNLKVFRIIRTRVMSKFMQELFSKNFLTGNVFKKK